MAVSVLWVFGALSFTYFAAVGLFNAYSPLWFKALGLPTVAIGLIASLQAGTRIVAPYAWCWLADHHGQRERWLRWACAMAAVSSLGLLLVPVVPAAWHLVWVCVVVLGIFLGTGGVLPLSEAALTQFLQSAQGFDAHRYSRVRVWGSIGFILAVAVFGFVLQAVGVAWLPLSAVALYALLAFTCWQVPTQAEAPHGVSADVGGNAQSSWAVLRQPEVAWTFASIFFNVLAHVSLYAFLSLYLDHLGYSKRAVGGLWAVGVAAEVVFFWTQSRWFARISPHAWLGLTAAVSAGRFALVAAFGGQGWLLVLTQLSHALTFAAHHSACMALIPRYFAGRLRSRGQALYSTLGYGVSGVIGGYGGGWLIEAWGHDAVFWAASAAGAAGAWCAWRAHLAISHAPDHAKPKTLA